MSTLKNAPLDGTPKQSIKTAMALTEKQAALEVAIEAIKGGDGIDLQAFLLRLAGCQIATSEHVIATSKEMLALQDYSTDNLAQMRGLVEAMCEPRRWWKFWK